MQFPNISPEIFSISLFGMEFALRWYALAYIVGILIGWRIVVATVNRPALWPKDTAPITARQIEDLLT
ncbi:prolipoprotein diacylglyceryl transferase, partial [Rhodobacteraceae bacterium R_SAG9]|nr:prolipoprotein diacylglyceryl transferase [Rhodobacteraceae bacterium R_SAG9]